MNKTKKQTHRYRQQTSGYQWGEGKGSDKIGVNGGKSVFIGLYEIMCLKLENCKAL